jgi:hypothetical protein
MKMTRALFAGATVAASALLWAASSTFGAQPTPGDATIDRADVAGVATGVRAGSRAVPGSFPLATAAGAQPRETPGPLHEELAPAAAT